MDITRLSISDSLNNMDAAKNTMFICDKDSHQK